MGGHSRAPMRHQQLPLPPHMDIRPRLTGAQCLETMTRGIHIRLIMSTVRCIKTKGCFIPKLIFKQVTVGQGPNAQRQFMVTEIDAEGTERMRRPEFFFHGIVGHVKDIWGYRINGWKEASRLANYWRRYFDIGEIPYSSHSTEPHEHLSVHDVSDPPQGDEPLEDDAGDTSSMGHLGDQTPSVPQQISQLAHILYDAESGS